MKMQLDSEEKTMKEMIKAMQGQAVLKNAEAPKAKPVHNEDTK